VSGFRVSGDRVSGFGFRVSGVRVSGFGFQGFGFRVSGVRVSDFGFRVSGFRVSGVRVCGLWFGVWGLGFTAEVEVKAAEPVPAELCRESGPPSFCRARTSFTWVFWCYVGGNGNGSRLGKNDGRRGEKSVEFGEILEIRTPAGPVFKGRF
jgi:hypothetical protein